VREPETEMRLNKFLAHAGVAARRKADEYIADGDVRVNGKIVKELGTKIHPAKDVVTYRGNQVMVETQLVYMLLNKPKDCISTVDDEKDRTTVMDLLPRHNRVFPIGRLDRNTTGVLLLTNDGDMAYTLTHPKFEIEKSYIVEINDKISDADVKRLQNGVVLDDGKTAPADVEVLDPPHGKTIGLIIHEGKNRQVRRMFEALNFDVKKLERIQYAGLTAAGLKRGGWRYLEEHEVNYLKKLTQGFERKSD
jgi:23S rRNA pseudouridine2605 synthase